MRQGAFYTGIYPNQFERIGIDQATVDRKIQETFQTLFFDPEEKIYFEMGADKAYMLDTGNIDARSEGMSYGMMMAVQMDRKDIFDKLWLFSKTYMHQAAGKFQGYFAWSVSTEGVKNSDGPAPDGEEYFAMALFFASARWGDGKPPFDYCLQARDILTHCIHQHEMTLEGRPMWAPENHLIRFVPEADFSDPSYHLPHFYELFAEGVLDGDRAFWKTATAQSRQYIQMACHPETGMASEYAEYDGTPRHLFHDGEYYSDAYRVAMNIGLDALWFGMPEEYACIIDRLQSFFEEPSKTGTYKCYLIDGTAQEKDAMHPTAIIATHAAGSIAAGGPLADYWLRLFWETPLRQGERRYYDNCLYFFSLLMLGGRYRIYRNKL